MIEYSQYFTTELFANVLISTIKTNNVSRILDLGIGDGALSYAALSRWPEATITAFDIDKKICEQYNDIERIKVYNKDVLDVNLYSLYNMPLFDLAICNPPYGKIKKEDKYNDLFERANMEQCCALGQMCTDIVFIAQNLIMLKEGGFLAVILPDGLLTRKDYLSFRESILNNYHVHSVLQLPEKSFSGTEARTHILIIQKNPPVTSDIEVSLLNRTGIIEDTLYVPSSCLIERMDYTFNHWLKKSHFRKTKCSTNVNIKRGGFSYKEIKELGIEPYLHSNSYNNGDILTNKSNINPKYKNKTIAKSGDIIMCRVGKRCVGKLAYIKEGEYLISDCLYKITLPLKISIKIFEEMQKKETLEWISISAHGVCSKVISMSDLKNFITTLYQE